MTDYGMALPRPMLATLGTELPRGKDWTYEVKWDGYRALAVKGPNGAQLISRNQKNLTNDYPSVVKAVDALPIAPIALRFVASWSSALCAVFHWLTRSGLPAVVPTWSLVMICARVFW